MIIREEELNEYSLITDETYYIYFLYYENDLVYIGQTQSLDVRIKSHKKDKLFDTVKIKRYNNISKEEILRIERSNINTYNPIFNDTVRLYKKPDFVFMKSLGKFNKGELVILNNKKNYYYYDGEDFYSLEASMTHIKIYKNLNLQETIKIDMYKDYAVKFDHTIKSFVYKEYSERENSLIFKKGKYKGSSLTSVKIINPEYIKWCLNTIPNFEYEMLYDSRGFKYKN